MFNMQKIFAALAITASLCACTDSEKEANKAFVEASIKVSKAAQAFDNADYALARELCAEAKSDVDRISASSPETQIALKIASSADTQIGVCSFRTLSDKVLPALEKHNVEGVKEISYAYAIAITDKRPNDACVTLAREVLTKCANGGKNYFSNPQKTLDAILANISDPTKRINLIKTTTPIKNEQEQKLAEQTKSSSKKIANESFFLSAANTAAILVTRNEQPSKRLAEMAEDATQLSNPEAFFKILEKAFKNAQRIGAPSSRNRACAKIAEACATMGRIKDAAKMSAITSGEPFENLMKKIAESVKTESDCEIALSLLPRLTSADKRDAFLASLAENAASNIGAKAIPITDKIRNHTVRHTALIKLGENAKNEKVLAEAVARINLSRGDAWIDNYRAENSAQTKALQKMSRYAQLAKDLISSDKGLATKMNDRAAEISAQTEKLQMNKNGRMDKSQFVNLCEIVIKNYSLLGDEEKALAFYTRNISDIIAQKKVFDDYCDMACRVYSKNQNLAMKALELCSGLDSNVRFAFKIQLAGLKKSDCLKLLSKHLPKFADFSK